MDGYSLVKIAGEMGLPLEDTALMKASLMKRLGAKETADLVRIGIYGQTDRDR